MPTSRARTRWRSGCSPRPQVQFCYEIAGPHDIVALFDCESMSAFNDAADEILTSSPTVRRYETHFVKREIKFAPFVELSETS